MCSRRGAIQIHFYLIFTLLGLIYAVAYISDLWLEVCLYTCMCVTITCSMFVLVDRFCHRAMSLVGLGLCLSLKADSSEKNRQKYKRCVVYLKTSNLRNLVYHYNMCAEKNFLKFMLLNEPSTNLCVIDINYEVYRLYVFVLLFTFTSQ